MTEVETLPIGPELRKIRELHKLSLRKVASKVGISNSYLSQIETGYAHKPSSDVLFKLAEVYGLKHEDLMRSAGYLTDSVNTEGVKHPKTAEGVALASMELTAEEERGLWLYLTKILRHTEGGR